MESWFVSSAMVGAVIGCALAGKFRNKYGRQKALFVASLFLLICSLGCSQTWSIGSLIFFRWIGGVGIASMVCPLSISEVTTARLRGWMLTLFQLAFCVGIVATIVANTGLLSWHETIKGSISAWAIGLMVECEVWRSMLGMESIPSLLFFAMCIFVPESPRWLAEKGRSDEAVKVFTRINGKTVATEELASIDASLEEEIVALRELVKPGLRKVLEMALFLGIVSEFSGITTIWNFGP